MKTILLTIVAAALLWAAFLSPANAALTWNPPARYDHAFNGVLHARYVSGTKMLFLCGRAYACTPVGGDHGTRHGTCTMILPRVGAVVWFHRITGADLAALIRHERGHCNGWPANHPR